MTLPVNTTFKDVQCKYRLLPDRLNVLSTMAGNFTICDS